MTFWTLYFFCARGQGAQREIFWIFGRKIIFPESCLKCFIRSFEQLLKKFRKKIFFCQEEGPQGFFFLISGRKFFFSRKLFKMIFFPFWTTFEKISKKIFFCQWGTPWTFFGFLGEKFFFKKVAQNDLTFWETFEKEIFFDQNFPFGPPFTISFPTENFSKISRASHFSILEFFYWIYSGIWCGHTTRWEVVGAKVIGRGGCKHFHAHRKTVGRMESAALSKREAGGQ